MLSPCDVFEVDKIHIFEINAEKKHPTLSNCAMVSIMMSYYFVTYTSVYPTLVEYNYTF